MAAEQTHFDLIVIGTGAAGSACWFEARQRGKSVAVFEEDALGGECANFACIPTKALLHAAEVFRNANEAGRFGIRATPSVDYAAVKAWKDDVISETGAALGSKPYDDAGVTLIQHRATFTGPRSVQAGGLTYTADNFLIATGARPAIPAIEGFEDAGYLTFRDAIDLTALPQSIVILGGGPVGCEFATLFSSFGSRVTLVDRNERLIHREDWQAGELLAEEFKRQGVQVILKAEVKSVRKEKEARLVTVKAAGGEEVIRAEVILVAGGKLPNVEIGLGSAGVKFGDGGIEIDGQMRTSAPAIYAAGDVAGPYQFTHAASYQGKLAAAAMFGEAAQADYRAMPRCVFTNPEVCAVGLTEEQARAAHAAIGIGYADLYDNDRALTIGSRRGFVRVLTDGNGVLLGGVMVGPRAGEVMHELALAVKLRAKAADIAGLVHAFPTFSEALGAACAAVKR